MSFLLKAPKYVGVGDLVGSVTNAFGLRAYARAALGGKCVNIRPGSGAANFDVFLTADGFINMAAALSGVGVDATGLGAITGTTLTFAGGHIGDTVTGTGVAPGTWIMSGSSPTWTVSVSQTLGSVSMTLYWGMFVQTLYNQLNIGSGDATQATAANQPLLVPGAGPSAPFPALYFNGTSTFLDTGGNTQQETTSWVANSTNASAAPGPIYALVSASACGHAGGATGIYMFQGTEVTAAGANGVYHSCGAVFNGASSIIGVDGTNTTVNPGVATNAARHIGANIGNSQFFKNYMMEMVNWNTVRMTTTQLNSINTNKHAAWGF